MHLIASLAAGCSDAPNGTAEIYKRGTATRPSVFGDFEGLTSLPAAAVSLDSAGRAVVYVNEFVDVYIIDADGNQIDRFTVGSSASAVEVRSPAFTGTDYETGQAGAGKPVDLETILDAIVTSFGSTNWNVWYKGASTTLQAALADGAGSLYYFNVKDPAYGAVGDAATDDTAAIQAAMDAAAVAGGTVFFPQGTYKITSALVLDSGVNLLGVQGAEIRQTADDQLLNSIVANPYPQEIRGLYLHRNIAGNNDLIYFKDARLSFVDCVFESLSNAGFHLIRGEVSGGVECTLNVRGSQFNVDPNVSSCVKSVTTSIRVSVEDCRIYNTGTTLTYNNINIYRGVVANNYFYNGLLTGGTVGQVTLRQYVAAVGNEASYCAGTLPTAAAFFEVGSGGSSGYAESGNVVYVSQQRIYNVSTIAAADQQSILESRNGAQKSVTDDAVTVTIDTASARVCLLERHGTLDVVVTLTGLPPGAQLDFVLFNNHGSASGNVTFSANVLNATGPYTVNAMKFTLFHFASVVVNGTNYWVLLSSAANLTP